MSTIEERLRQAHKLLANATGRVSLQLAKKRIIRGELAHAALFAREAMVALETLRDGLPPPKNTTNETCEDETSEMEESC